MSDKAKKLLKKLLISVFVIIFIVVSGIYYLFFDIQRFKGEEILETVISPNNRYTVTAYLHNGGATVAYSVLGTVTDNKTGLKCNIYWQYRCSDAEIEWIDETTVVINGVELNVKKDKYDWRHQ